MAEQATPRRLHVFTIQADAFAVAEAAAVPQSRLLRFEMPSRESSGALRRLYGSVIDVILIEAPSSLHLGFPYPLALALRVFLSFSSFITNLPPSLTS